jgi:hypothetical protein
MEPRGGDGSDGNILQIIRKKVKAMFVQTSVLFPSKAFGAPSRASDAEARTREIFSSDNLT